MNGLLIVSPLALEDSKVHLNASSEANRHFGRLHLKIEMPLTARLCFWLQAKRSAFYYLRHTQVKPSFHLWKKIALEFLPGSDSIGSTE
jgi:hypothetical protein